MRVLRNSEMIAREESADLDVIVPSALFHDVITYTKDDPRSEHAAKESAERARAILAGLSNYPPEKIFNVYEAISCCSFRKGIMPESIESQILQDADGLEATGAISIMRTFSSTGQMGRQFYEPSDPFCESRAPEDMRYGLDLFYTRLLVVESRMHTKTAKDIARRRTRFLREFLDELKMELEGK
ncbi:MAG: HD domain-containing protein [Nanoarchaeota archaeon]